MSWPLVKIGEHLHVLSGFAFKSSMFSELGMPLIRIRDVVPGKTSTYYSGDYSNEYIVRKGDLLVGMDGDFNRAYWQSEDALLNQRVCKLTADDVGLDQGFLYHLLYKELLKIHRNTPAVTVKHLSVSKIKNIEIPLPPLDEQKRIAAILDKADTIRRKRQQAINLADDFLHSVFLDMFGDPFVNSKKWNIEALGELTTKITDGKHGDCEDESDSGYYFISAKNVNHGIINYQNTRQINKKEFDEVHRRTDLKSGDIVMVNTGATIGRVAIVRDDERNKRTTFQKSVAIIKLDKKLLNPTFLKFIFLLRIKDFASVGSGSAIKNLLLSKMREFPIIVPPLELQKDFEKIVFKMEQSSIHKEECAEYKQELFNSLSQKAFAGEL